MSYQTIIVETRGRVGVIRLNRPQALNALSSMLNDELAQAIAAFEADDGISAMLLTGSELSLFTIGFLPGETLAERLALVADPLRVRPMIGEVRARINDFLRRAVGVVRARFGGKVSYAALPLEGVDWAPFDIIATDAAGNRSRTACVGLMRGR